MNKRLWLVLGIFFSLNAFSMNKVGLAVTCSEGRFNNRGELVNQNIEKGLRVIIGYNYYLGLIEGKAFAILGKGGRTDSDPSIINDIFRVESVELPSSRGQVFEDLKGTFSLVTHGYTGVEMVTDSTLIFKGQKVDMVCGYPVDFHADGFSSTVKAFKEFLGSN